MKPVKCVVCLKTKGKRACQLNDMALICPTCCAQIRNAECQGCFYYSQAENYAVEKAKKPKTQHFTMRIDPEVDEAVDQALVMVESGKPWVGESIITDLLKKHPDLHTVQYGMGVVCASKGQYEEAIQYFDNAIKIFPYFVEAWFNKGVSYQKMVEPEEAIRAFRRVVEVGDPADAFVRQAKSLVDDMARLIRKDSGITLDTYLEAKDKFDAAFAAMENREWQLALHGFKAVTALNPTNPQSYGNMGICYAQLGRKQEALAALDRALELDPSYEPAMLNRLVVEKLQEGEKLPDADFASIKYYKDFR